MRLLHDGKLIADCWILGSSDITLQNLSPFLDWTTPSAALSHLGRGTKCRAWQLSVKVIYPLQEDG